MCEGGGGVEVHVLQVYTLRSVSENQNSMFDAFFDLSLTCFMAQVFSLKFKLAICVSKQETFLFPNTGNCVTRTCPHSQHLTVDERTDLGSHLCEAGTTIELFL